MEVKKREVFIALIKQRWGDSVTPSKDDEAVLKYDDYKDEYEEPRIIPDIEEPVDSTGKPINQQPFYDKLINAEVQLQMGDSLVKGKVIGRSVEPDGTIIGSYDDNPMLNSFLYDVEFPDGQVKEYLANVLAENMLTRVDRDGFSVTLLEAIIDYKKDESAINIADKYIITPKRRKTLCRTTQSWKLKVLWKDQSES